MLCESGAYTVDILAEWREMISFSGQHFLVKFTVSQPSKLQRFSRALSTRSYRELESRKDSSSAWQISRYVLWVAGFLVSYDGLIRKPSQCGLRSCVTRYKLAGGRLAGRELGALQGRGRDVVPISLCAETCVLPGGSTGTWHFERRSASPKVLDYPWGLSYYTFGRMYSPSSKASNLSIV